MAGSALKISPSSEGSGTSTETYQSGGLGSTYHPKNRAENDHNLQALIDANTPVVTIFGKTWDLHVKVALGISLQENLNLIRESVAFLRSKGKEVVYDAEHFFDGFKADPEYALTTLKVTEEAGAGTLVLCDTNGGTLTEFRTFPGGSQIGQGSAGNPYPQ